ncbi:unnamed protein product, partial [marine sediment metagenome]
MRCYTLYCAYHHTTSNPISLRVSSRVIKGKFKCIEVADKLVGFVDELLRTSKTEEELR